MPQCNLRSSIMLLESSIMLLESSIMLLESSIMLLESSIMLLELSIMLLENIWWTKYFYGIGHSFLFTTFLITLAWLMEQHALKNANNCLNTSNYSYLETSGGQSSNLYINVVHF